MQRWKNLVRGERIRAEVMADATSIYVYDVIDSWGGEWGVSAPELLTAMANRPGPLALHLNSPGGDYFEAVAMRAALAAHAGPVTVYIDGLAASAASVLATVGDRVVIAPGAQIMVHNASSGVMGNAAELRKQADLLASIDLDIASFYALKAGGEPKDWSAAMDAETWYTAEQAVAIGLADEVAGEPIAPPVEEVDRLATAWAALATQTPAPTAVAPPGPVLPAGPFDLAELISSAVRRDTT